MKPSFLIDKIFKPTSNTIEEEKSYWDKFWRKKISSGSFSEITNWFQKMAHKRAHDLIHSLLGNVKHKEFLEIGSGSGYNSILLSMEGVDCTVLDSSKFALKYSEKLSQKVIKRENTIKIKYVLGQVEEIPFKDESFDAVYSCGLIEHFNDQKIKKIILEIKRVLQNNGQIIVLVPNLMSPEIIYRMIKFGRGSERYLTKKKLKNMLKEVGFKDVIVKSAMISALPSFIPESVYNKLNWLNHKLKFLDYLFYGRAFKKAPPSER